MSAEREEVSAVLLAELHRVMENENCSVSVALAEVSKRWPSLWRVYSRLAMEPEGATEPPAELRLKVQNEASRAFLTELDSYARANNCSGADALLGLTRRNPRLWELYSEAVTGFGRPEENE